MSVTKQDEITSTKPVSVLPVFKRILYHPFFIRLFNWEYWSFTAVYAPIYFYWFWLCFKARSFFFFNTSNPTIENGGFLLESKKKIYDIIPKKFYPDTLFFKANVGINEMMDAVKNSSLTLPLIGKPDIGGKGRGVKKLCSYNEIKDYASSSKVDFLLQNFVPYENEVGIFYYRLPNEPKGNISGIVEKEFLAVTGNGISTIEKLLKADKRFVLQLKSLQKEYKHQLKNLLPQGEKFLMVPYGNHARGAKFIDKSNMIDETLINSIDAICKQVPGFYFGRLDVRFNTWQELRNGENISIIELNGAGSEPTHMYDPTHSLFFAWKVIIKHWKLLYEISRINHIQQHLPYMKVKDGLAMLKGNARHIKLVTG